MSEAKAKRPTDDELAKLHAALSASQKPEDFLKKVESIGAKIPTAEIWGNRYKFVREAMTLAEFTKLSPVDTVRLGEDPPDGRIGTPTERRVEITEAIEPGRKRGDEYKPNRVGDPDQVTQDQLAARIRKLEPELERVIQMKAGKYEVHPTLLVYLNIVDHHQVAPALVQQRWRDRRCFAESLKKSGFLNPRQITRVLRRLGLAGTNQQ
jgi:hypothetical protein